MCGLSLNLELPVSRKLADIGVKQKMTRTSRTGKAGHPIHRDLVAASRFMDHFQDLFSGFEASENGILRKAGDGLLLVQLK